MKFYIASSFSNSDKVRQLSNDLKSKGHIHTYDWTKAGKVNTYDQLSIIGEIEKEAVLNSDFLVIILPAGKGSHIEYGIATSHNKRIYIYSSTNEVFNIDSTSTFYHLKGIDRYVGTLESFSEYLIQKEEVLDL